MVHAHRFVILCLVLWIAGTVALRADGPPPAQSAQGSSAVSGDAAAPPAPSAAGDEVKPNFTEVIEVTAVAPKAHPVSAAVDITSVTIQSIAPRDLSQVMSFASGTFVSVGNKNEYTLKIRGLDSQKIALLYDGIPVYEPYFGSFDLKSFLAEEVAEVNVVKGATSVLFGPNLLGGGVNIVTRRPEEDSLRLTGEYSSFDFGRFAANGTVRRGRFGFSGSFTFDRSNEYDYVNSAGDSVLRANSDYQREGFNGKFYFFPSEESEWMAEASYYHSEYGMPAATETFRARYWRFPDWDRFIFGVGGSFPLAANARMKVRGYYVRYHNVLDSFRDAAMQDREWRSTFNNYSYGVFALGSWAWHPQNELKFSLNVKSDHARQQDDVDAPWYEYSQDTVSAGVEDHFALTERWTLVGGVSVDYLNKESGNNQTAANPLAGIRYQATPELGFYGSFSQKSRFPNMRALYSSTGGNPDLREERGSNWEAGVSFEREVALSGAVFYNRIRDLIETVRMPDGTRVYINIGDARITGFELSAARRTGWLQASANYTFLDAVNEDADRPLDLTPRHQANAIVDILPSDPWRISLWGLAASRCQTLNGNKVVEAAGYFLANVGATYRFREFELYAQAENLLDKAYMTEPGYPLAGRSFKVGLRWAYDRD